VTLVTALLSLILHNSVYREEDMKRTLSVIALVALFVLAVPNVAFAAPNENASHVANCAIMMGGQHIAECAQTMDKGVSECAQMKGPCEH
jgi:hypothetical protein